MDKTYLQNTFLQYLEILSRPYLLIPIIVAAFSLVLYFSTKKWWAAAIFILAILCGVILGIIFI